MENVVCDYCNSNASRVIFRDVVDNVFRNVGTFHLVECLGCGLLYLNPRPTSQALEKFYPPDYTPYQKENTIFLFLRRILWQGKRGTIKKLVKRGGSILEIGPAGGDFLTLFKNDGYELYGLEMDKNSVEHAVRNHGLNVWHGKFEEFDFSPDQKFDFIIMRFVLEHLPSPTNALRKARTLLKDNGYLWISIPNFHSWERMVFGRYWHCLEAPRHLYIFTESIVQRLVWKAGFEVIGVSYGFLPNDWIGGIARFLHERGFFSLSRFFHIKNPLLILLFFPLSLAAGLAGKSSRFTFLIKRV